MNKKITSTVLIYAIILTSLFHNQTLGLNLLIAEVSLLFWLLLTKQLKLNGIYPITIGFAFLVSSFFTVITYSIFSYIINFLLLFLLIGLIIYPQTKSLIFSIGYSVTNIFNSQILFFKTLSATKLKGKKISSYFRKLGIYIIPIAIIIFYIIIYRASNPIFDGLIGKTLLNIQNILKAVFQHFDLAIIFTFIICLFISSFVFFRKRNTTLFEIDKSSQEEKNRISKSERRTFRLTALKNEYKSGVFILLILNLLLLLLNVLDIRWVWFGFEYEGQNLKQFVHEGTYLLLLSIIISIIVVLYYFRNNLNFYSKNKSLKILSYIWLAQNAILSISVAIRNFWYIDYFALAYKRIGVMIFLILTIYGLYTVFIKVKNKKTSFYLFKTNIYAMVLVLSFSSFINWDNVIAKYNFKHSDQSFLHLDYLSGLSDKSLPYLDKPIEELKIIDKIQKQKFTFKQEYLSPDDYHLIIEYRKEKFIEEWESKSFLSWNFAEYMAYQKLKEKKVD